MPLMAVAEPRALPSMPYKLTFSLLSRPEMLMKPPADWMVMPRASTDSIPSVSSIALIVPNPLQGAVVL